MADLVLRNYQHTLVEDIRAAWTRTRSVLAWMPTGGGVGKREGPGSGPHAARLECAHCGHFIKWLPRQTVAHSGATG